MNAEGVPGSGPQDAAPGPQDAASNRPRPFAAAGRRLGEGGAAALLRSFGHLLRQNDWARAKLAMFAGRTVWIGVDTPSLRAGVEPHVRARITAEGLLEPIAGEFGPGEPAQVEPGRGESTHGESTQPESADVRMMLRPSFGAAMALLRTGPRGLAPHLRLDGDVMLAAALGEVAEQIRWDVEEDLSRLTGDVLARRIGRGVESARDAFRDLRARIESSTGRHLAGESGQLVGRTQLDSLRSSLDSLEARVSRLEAPTGEQADPYAVPPQLLPPLEMPDLDVDPEAPEPPRAGGESD